MSSSVIEEIERIRRAILEESAIYAKGRGAERNSLEHLVRPLLLALGWHPRYIRSEYPVEMNDASEEYADFVLFHEQQPILVIEGKKLGSYIGSGSEAVQQLTRHLIGLDCQFGITTEGQLWSLWKKNGYQMESLWSVDLVNVQTDLATKLLGDIRYESIGELKENIEYRQVRKATLESAWVEMLDKRHLQVEAMAEGLKNLVDTIDEGLGIKRTHAVEYLESIYSGAPKLIIPPSANVVSVESYQTESGSPTRQPPPRCLVIQNDKIPISDVYEILTKTAEWLVEGGYLSRNDCPVQVTSGNRAFRFLVNTSPIHSNGQAFSAPREIAAGMYVETHYNREQAEYYATKLLQRFLPSGELRIEV